MSQVSPEGPGWQVLPDGWLGECVGRAQWGSFSCLSFLGWRLKHKEAQGTQDAVGLEGSPRAPLGLAMSFPCLRSAGWSVNSGPG